MSFLLFLMRRFDLRLFLACIVFCLFCSDISFAEIERDSNSVQIGKSVVASGGGQSSTSIFQVKATVGQAAIGSSSNSTFLINSGFWGSGGGGNCCIGFTGDLDSDGNPNTVLDLTFLVDNIYRGGPDPACLTEGDLNGDGQPLEVQDLTVMIDFIYRGGPQSSACVN